MLFLFFKHNYIFSRSVTSLLIAVLAITSTMQLPAQESSRRFSIGLGSIKKNIRRYVKKVLNVHSHMTVGEVKSILDSFRHYTKKITGHEISGRELYYMADHELSRKHSIDTSSLKSLFMTKEEMSFDEYLNSLPLEQRLGMMRKTLFSRNHLKKSFKNDLEENCNNKEVEVDGQVIIGFVLIACATLIGAIGFAIPPVSPVTSSIASTVGGTGLGLVANGLYCTGENNRKRKFFYVPEQYIDTILSIDESTEEEDQA